MWLVTLSSFGSKYKPSEKKLLRTTKARTEVFSEHGVETVHFEYEVEEGMFPSKVGSFAIETKCEAN